MTEVVGERSWTRRVAVVSDRPEARLGHAASFDRARGEMLLFGGRISLGGRALSDVWEWDGTRWDQVTVRDPENDGSPSARMGAALVYDAARGVSVLFGGYETAADGYGTRRDTWTWAGSSWVDHTVAEPDWEDTPWDRVGHGMVYDSGAGAVLLYGGLRFSTDPPIPRQDTYRWDGETWESLDQWNGPPPRYLHGMAYDPVRDRTVVFGGCNDYPGSRLPTLPDLYFSCRSGGHELTDTWEWDGRRWQEAAVGDPEGDQMPAPRYGHRMVWLPALGKIVLHGGMTRRSGDCPADATSEDDDYCWFSDMWAWEGRSWARLAPADGAERQPLAARAGHSLVLDTQRQRLVAFGGYLDDEVELAAGERPLDDLWSWDGATWVEQRVGGAWDEPPARSHHRLAWDAVGARTLLFGGVVDGEGAACPAGSEAAVLYSSYCLFHDLWAWSGSGWTELTPAVRGDSPPPRTEGGAAFDAGRGTLVLFGGQYSQWPHRQCDDGTSPNTTSVCWRGDTWEWDGDGWREVVPQDVENDGNPSPRDRATLVYDEVLGEVLMYGGTVDVGAAGDPCPDGRIAGNNGYCNLGEVWSWNGTRWLDRGAPAGGAEGRYGQAMAYDALREVTLVYGGDRYIERGQDNLADAWEWDGAAWRQGDDGEGDGPGARRYAALAHDPTLGRSLLFGGHKRFARGDYRQMQDVWAWDGTTWSELSLTGLLPDKRAFHDLAFDRARGRLVLFGGIRAENIGGYFLAAGEASADTWELGGDATDGPAALWVIDWRSAQVPASAWEGLTVRATASGLGHGLDLDPADDGDLVGEAVPGVALSAWDVRLGAWRELDRGQDAGDVPATLGWDEDGADEAGRLLLPSDGRLHLALQPLAGLGNGTGDARVQVDWVELRVRYRWPAQ